MSIEEPPPAATPENRNADYADRVVLVTGAASGIGRATVEGAVRRGALVVAQDISAGVTDLERTYPDVVVTSVGDAGTEDAASSAVHVAMERFGRLDVLVASAGRTLNKPLVETTTAEWDDVLRVNARSAFLFTRESLAVMPDQQGAALVFIASFAATVALPDGVAYAASKGALSQLMKVAAVEGAPRGIRSNAVAPGVVDTTFLNDIRPDGQEYLRSFGTAHPLGRIAQPGEIADVVLALASREASFVTGALIPVDGGYTAI